MNDFSVGKSSSWPCSLHTKTTRFSRIITYRGRLGELLGGLWDLLWTSWGPLGELWGVLGGLLGTSWGSLGASWGSLGASWGPLGGSSTPLGGVLGTLVEIFSVTWGLFGTFRRPSGCQKVPQGLPRGAQVTTKTVAERVVSPTGFPMQFKAYFQRVFESRAQAWECVKCAKMYKKLQFLQYFKQVAFSSREAIFSQKKALRKLQNRRFG